MEVLTMVFDKSNEVMMNHYKKLEIIKAQKRLTEEKMPIVKVLQLADKEFITAEELLDIFYISKEQVLDEILNTTIVTENIADVPKNTTNVSRNTPMELAKAYKEYYEKYNHDRKKICKEKNIANGTFQKYLRLNYLIPELQDLVDNKKLAVVPAEHISYLDKNTQENIGYLIKHFKCEITTGVAKKIKEDYLLCKKNSKLFNLNELVIKKYKREKDFKIVFTEDEANKYFTGIPKKQIKEYILKVLNLSYKNQI